LVVKIKMAKKVNIEDNRSEVQKQLDAIEKSFISLSTDVRYMAMEHKMQSQRIEYLEEKVEGLTKVLDYFLQQNK